MIKQFSSKKETSEIYFQKGTKNLTFDGINGKLVCSPIIENLGKVLTEWINSKLRRHVRRITPAKIEDAYEKTEGVMLFYFYEKKVDSSLLFDLRWLATKRLHLKMEPTVDFWYAEKSEYPLFFSNFELGDKKDSVVLIDYDRGHSIFERKEGEELRKQLECFLDDFIGGKTVTHKPKTKKLMEGNNSIDRLPLSTLTHNNISSHLQTFSGSNSHKIVYFSSKCSNNFLLQNLFVS